MERWMDLVVLLERGEGVDGKHPTQNDCRKRKL